MTGKSHDCSATPKRLFSLYETLIAMVVMLSEALRPRRRRLAGVAAAAQALMLQFCYGSDSS